MELKHSFVVPAGTAETWAMLLEPEQIAGCLPGVIVEEASSDAIDGRARIKLGPLNLTYRGRAELTGRDDAALRAVVHAHGEDMRGHGTAALDVTAVLTGDDGTTTVELRSLLQLTGKPEQFSTAVMSGVGDRLVARFAACLASSLAPSEPDVTASVPAADVPTAVGGLESSYVMVEPATVPSHDDGRAARDGAPVYPDRSGERPRSTTLAAAALAAATVAVVLLVTARRRRAARAGSRTS